VRQSLASGLARAVTTEPAPRGGVGYGGGVYAVHQGRLVYAARDGRLHAIDLESGEQWPVGPAYEGVAAPALSPCGKFVAFLAEADGRANVLVAPVRGSSLAVKLSEDPWYAFNPAFSPDGLRLAWQEWDEADMPWQQSRIVIADLARGTEECNAPYELLPASLTAIEEPRSSHGSPQFSPDGRHLAFVSDRTGWRSLWVADPGGAHPVRIETGEGEIGRPDWVPGLVPFRWSPHGRSLYAVRRHRSSDTLLRIAWPELKVTEFPMEWTEIEGLNISKRRGGPLVLIGSNPTEPPTLLTLDQKAGMELPRAGAAVGLIDPASLSQPEVISWSTPAEVTAWGILYRAVGSETERRRPLIVSVHGGPTSERSLGWDPQAQFFATRGWHYLALNHRGSSGFGRAYQEMLDGQWGVVDVQDACTGALHLINGGIADPQRLVIMGASAGGYTTLMALSADPTFWAAGVSVFGVGDLYELKLGSHRFEVHYEEGLIGRLPESGAVWKERSPLTHAAAVRAPVLLFHGTADRAVPHRQSVDFAESVRRAGGIAELVSYEGEGHGFEREANRRDMLLKIEAFLEKYVINMQR
jgi:dipeptidyl aminopeptidase/acylaminoacyl peptidase